MANGLKELTTEQRIILLEREVRELRKTSKIFTCAWAIILFFEIFPYIVNWVLTGILMILKMF